MLQADINLNILAENLTLLKQRANALLWFVVKANAYGHGLIKTAKYAKNYCDELAVATFEEAAELAEGKVNMPINVLGAYFDDEFRQFQSILATMPHITPTISDISQLKALNPSIKTINIKLNTGMNRLGTDFAGLKQIVHIAAERKIKIKSIFTHFYKGSILCEAQKQFDMFNKMILPYRKTPIQFHCAASSFLDLPASYCMNAVRCGISAYGYSPVTKPVMKLYTNIAQVHSALQGSHIGYGDYIAPCDMKLAVIRIGYGDGFKRKLTPYDERFVCINDTLCPIVGQICMDMCMVDVSRIKLCGNEKVYILNEHITAFDLAKSYRTIPYEVLTALSGRIKRNYIETST